jgi:hypothetical protein
MFGKWLHWLWCWWYRIINVSPFGQNFETVVKTCFIWRVWVCGLSQMKLTTFEKTVTFWDDPLVKCQPSHICQGEQRPNLEHYTYDIYSTWHRTCDMHNSSCIKEKKTSEDHSSIIKFFSKALILLLIDEL